MDEVETISAYLRAYERRARQRGNVFDAPQQAGLAALAVLDAGRVGATRATLVGLLSTLDVCTRPVLESRDEHSLALNMSGYAWAAAYGLLPMLDPPGPQVHRALGSGGPVSGATGVAWRTLFLLTAWPFLNADARPRADAELARRLEDLPTRVAALEVGSSVAPQLVVSLTEIGRRGGLEQVARMATELRRAQTEPPADAATVDICRWAWVAGPSARARIRTLVSERRDPSSQLIRAAADRLELSPVVPLGLAAALGTQTLESSPRALREAAESKSS